MNMKNHEEFYAAIETISDKLGVARGELIYTDGRVNSVALRNGLKAGNYRIQLTGVADSVMAAVREIMGWQRFDKDGKYLGDTSVVSLVRQLPLEDGSLPEGASMYRATLTPETGEPVTFFCVLGIPRSANDKPSAPPKPKVVETQSKKTTTRPPIREPERGGSVIIKDAAILEIGRHEPEEDSRGKPTRRPKHGKSGTERRLKDSRWK